MYRIARSAVVFLVALMLVGIGFVAGTSLFSARASQSPVRFVEMPALQQAPVDLSVLSPDERAIAEIYQRVSPSVVSINVITSGGGGGGSGFVFDQQGHIITNYHVIAQTPDLDREQIEVNFLDGTIVPAEVVGLDPDSDIAVIKVNLSADRLIPVTFGNSDGLIVGQSVLAIGSPFGERWTLTTGIVSALERTIRGLNDRYSIGGVIQTDAAINPGNSGGPLLNLRGEVIGVNAQIRTESGTNSGVGFAIPGLLVQRVARELVEKGEVNYSLIGLTGGSINLAAIEALNLANNQRGVVVSEVIPGLPAAEGGLRPAVFTEQGELVSADVIVAINGTPLNGMESLIGYLARFTQPGDTVTLTVLRDGQTIELTVTLISRDDAARS
ncbi:MAG: trypsin-like peptidase domain-containing protein [Anaerolineae bacterium]|jgi:2-alkenal reductase|nr:trypsin-like peptidase domain-containing protein [Anaerolineae bacterium]